ncbi:MAG: hypothetical protein HOJ02_09625 [Rhodospirillaceae bacterium]|jgi:hypothetical protein|nr:hypothetical protein [Rhodospirillaceae bacterium]MBT5660397.1 hypothetical protein [Rhodospirillaceae bacterium]
MKQFDNIARGIIKVTHQASVPETLHIRRMTLADEATLNVISLNHLKVIFNVVLTHKMSDLDPKTIKKARQNGAAFLLAESGDEYPPALREEDLDVLENALVQVSAEILEKEVEGELGSEATGKTNKDGAGKKKKKTKADAEGNENPAIFFTDYFDGFILRQIEARLALIAAPISSKAVMLSPDLAGIATELFFKAFALGEAVTLWRRTKKEFVVWREANDIDLMKADGEAAIDGLFNSFFEAKEGQDGLGKLLSELGEIAARFKDIRVHAADALEVKEETGLKAKLQRVLKKKTGAPRLEKVKKQRFNKIAKIDKAISQAIGEKIAGKPKSLTKTEIGFICTAIGETSLERFTMLERDVKALWPENDQTVIYAEEHVKEITDKIYLVLRDNKASYMEVGLLFARLIYGIHPFNLRYLSKFFDGNSRFQQIKVMRGFPYLKNALLWHLNAIGETLIKLAEEDNEEEFDHEAKIYSNSRNAVINLEYKGQADAVARKIIAIKPAFEDKERQALWKKKLKGFSPM